MTAEIAILNSYGIALAADSAVTIANKKVYNGADKLFALSKYQPVAIMVYNDAGFMGIPWEIIIKQYRADLGRTEFPTLIEYADHFWEFITETDNVIPQLYRSEYIAHLAHLYLENVRLTVEKAAEKQISAAGQITAAETLSFLRSTLTEMSSDILKLDFIVGFDQADTDEALVLHRPLFDEVLVDELGALAIELSETEKNSIFNTIGNLLVRRCFPAQTSGVVFAGYGTTEIFPKIASYIVEGIACNKVRKILIEDKSNINNERFVTTIVPFAQDEMVWTFINGVDPHISQFTLTYLENVFADYPDALGVAPDNIDLAIFGELKLRLQTASRSLLSQLRLDVKKYQDDVHRQPILEMVGSLPKDELAAMAESLVNLTAFKHKISKALQTVGGPIDVAVISKGDGFIWVKRKHYFRPELNQRFFSNYFSQDEQ